MAAEVVLRHSITCELLETCKEMIHSWNSDITRLKQRFETSGETCCTNWCSLDVTTLLNSLKQFNDAVKACEDHIVKHAQKHSQKVHDSGYLSGINQEVESDAAEGEQTYPSPVIGGTSALNELPQNPQTINHGRSAEEHEEDRTPTGSPMPSLETALKTTYSAGLNNAPQSFKDEGTEKDLHRTAAREDASKNVASCVDDGEQTLLKVAESSRGGEANKGRTPNDETPRTVTSAIDDNREASTAATLPRERDDEQTLRKVADVGATSLRHGERDADVEKNRQPFGGNASAGADVTDDGNRTPAVSVPSAEGEDEHTDAQAANRTIETETAPREGGEKEERADTNSWANETNC